MRSTLTVKLSNDLMMATQSSLARYEGFESHFYPAVCCKAENVLDGVFQMERDPVEIQYVSHKNAQHTKYLLIDTAGPETISRVSCYSFESWA